MTQNKRWNLENDPETKEIMQENLTEYKLRQLKECEKNVKN